MLDENGSIYNKDYVYEDYFVSSTIEQAYSLVPNGKKLKQVPVTDIKTSSSVSEGIFFDDEITKSLFYPGLVKGAETFLRYKEHYKEPRLFGSYFFQSGSPVDESVVSVEMPKDAEIDYTLMNCDSIKVTMTQSETSISKIYTWKAYNVKPAVRDQDAPAGRLIAPHIIFRIKSYTKKNGTKVNMLADVNDLYKWQSGFISHLDKEAHDQLKFTVDSLTKNITDEKEKIRAIFSYIQDNIKYLAIEDKLGGFIPRQASDILKHKYGDCKDIANLTRLLLNIAGVNAHLAWIGTREIPYASSKFPSPMCFNHMIVYLTTAKGEGFFLDGTGKHQAWYFPTDMIQGKEALVGIDSNHFQNIKVPEIPMEKSVRTDSIHISVKENIVIGNQKSTFTGYLKEGLDRSLEYLKNDGLADFIKERFATGNNKISVNEPITENNTSREVPSNVLFKFILPSYCQRVDKELFINMNISKPFTNEYDISKGRSTPIELDNKYMHFTRVFLEIPQGGKIGYLPKDASYENSKFGFNISYHNNGKSIVMDRKIYLNTLMIMPEDFKDLTQMIDQLSKNYSETISITF